MRKGGVTIEDVAARVGVSRQTISRVINNGPNVKPAVREKVEAAIAELGYVPSLSARRMGGGRSYVILAINDRARTLENWQAGRGNDWVDQMLYGGMTECEKHGYHMVFELIETDPQLAPRQLVKVISSIRPDGVILTPPHSDNDALAQVLVERRVPCARIGRSENGAFVDVSMDEAGAADEVTRRMIALGHTRIAFVSGSPEYGNSRLRIESFRRAIDDAGLQPEAAMVAKGDFHFETAGEQVEALLVTDDPPTAIIADNDEMAFSALHVANRMGLAVPGELSVVSFEDTPGVRFSVPPLSAIRQPTAQMIACACQKLISIAGGKNEEGRYVLPYEFIERATTGPVPPRTI